MSRTQRLFDLIQILRRNRYPISGTRLAEMLQISLRTLYRDIATLQAQGAAIVGEPGVGYILQPGFLLPPLMFSEEEIEALVLGSRWVASRTDNKLGLAATNVLAKIAAVLPEDLRHQLEFSGLHIGPAKTLVERDDEKEALIRHAIRKEYKLQIAYTVTVGVKSHAQTQWESVTVQKGNYLVFQGKGPMPATVIETWKQVWAFFDTNPDYRRNFMSDFEAYSGPQQVAIYIGLE